MEFGLFIELIALRPHDDAAIVRCYNEALEQIVYAEKMGFDAVWETEHHFTTKFSYSSAPELFLTAAAQRTSTIRIGHGVVLLTMNDPVRAAERGAVLDILSNGRLEFGTGRGTSDIELGGFNINADDSRDMWDEAVRMIPKMWTQDTFEHHGKYFDVPERSIIPKPVQKPHPPMWVSGVSPRTFELAGEMGLGILAFSLSAPGQSEAAVKEYRRRSASADPIGSVVTNKVASFTVGMCLEDAAEAREVARFAAGAYATGAASLVPKLDTAGDWKNWHGRLYYVETDVEPDEIGKLVDDSIVCVGDPDDCTRVVKHWEEIGVDQIMLIMQAGRVPHDKIMESIRMFGEHVIPKFKKQSAAASTSGAAP